MGLPQSLIRPPQFAHRPAGDHHAGLGAAMVDARSAIQRHRHPAAIWATQYQLAIGQADLAMIGEQPLGGFTCLGIGEEIE